MKYNKIIKVLFCVFFFAMPILAKADDVSDGNGNGDMDNPAAPIDNWIPFMLVIGIALVYYYTSKRKASTN